MAGHGKAWLGMVRTFKISMRFGTAGCGVARRGEVWTYKISMRQGTAGFGKVRRGAVRIYKIFMRRGVTGRGVVRFGWDLQNFYPVWHGGAWQGLAGYGTVRIYKLKIERTKSDVREKTRGYGSGGAAARPV